MAKPVFEGVGTALVTPFHPDGTVNFEKLEELTERQVAGGADAIIAVGTTGEKSTLRHDEHVQTIACIIKTVAGRIPVVAGTTGNDTQYSLELTKAVEAYHPDALLMVTPYYNKTSQEGLYQHYTYLADRVETPIILYNVPSRTGMTIKPETYARLCRHPNIVATKEASGNFSDLAKTVHLCGDELTVYSGNDDQTVAMMAMGAKGVISVAANLIPGEMHALCKKALQGDFAGAMALQNKYLDFMNSMFVDVNPIPVKEALNLLGMNVGECRLPLYKTSEANRQAIAEQMRRIGLL